MHFDWDCEMDLDKGHYYSYTTSKNYGVVVNTAVNELYLYSTAVYIEDVEDLKKILDDYLELCEKDKNFSPI